MKKTSSDLRRAEPVIIQRQVPPKPSKKKILKERNRFYYQLNKFRWSELPPPEYDAQRMREYQQNRYNTSARYRKYMSEANARARDWKNGNTKFCKRCQTTKAMSDFPFARDSRNKSKRVRKTYCRECRSEINRNYYLRRTYDTERVS